MSKTARLLVLLTTVLAVHFSLIGCNTVKGAGQDVKAAGSAVEKEAKEKKTY